MVSFLGVIPVPVGNFHRDVRSAVRHGLAAQAWFRRDTRRLIELVELGVGRFITRLQTFFYDHVAGGASTHAAAGVIQPRLDSFRNIKNAAWQAVVPVRNFLRINLYRLTASKIYDFVFLRVRLVFNFFDLGVAAAHLFLLTTISKSP